jgi:threonine/homoserine/homoserine lactone efflux protein
VVVNALAGVQFALLIIAVALLSKFSPQTFKESYRGQEIFQEILGVVIIAVGLVLIIR